MKFGIREAHKRAHYGEARARRRGGSLIRWVALFALALPPVFASPAPLQVSTPTIQEPPNDGYVVNPADLHMEITGYSDLPENDAHQSTDWELWKTSLNERIWSAL